MGNWPLLHVHFCHGATILSCSNTDHGPRLPQLCTVRPAAWRLPRIHHIVSVSCFSRGSFAVARRRAVRSASGTWEGRGNEARFGAHCLVTYQVPSWAVKSHSPRPTTNRRYRSSRVRKNMTGNVEFESLKATSAFGEDHLALHQQPLVTNSNHLDTHQAPSGHSCEGGLAY